MLEHRGQSVHDTVVGRTAPHSERLISAQQQGDMHVCRRQIRPQLLLFVRSKNMHLYKQQLQSCCTSQTNYETIKISTIDSVPVHCAIVPDSKSGDQALLLIQWTLTYPNTLGPTPVHISEMFIYVKYYYIMITSFHVRTYTVYFA